MMENADKLVTIVLALVAGIVAYYAYSVWTFFADLQRCKRYIQKLPGMDSHWLLGHLFDFPGPNEEGFAFLREKVAMYPRLLRMWYGPLVPAVWMVHPDTVKAILKSSEPKAHTNGPYKFMVPWLGDGLLVSGGQKWHRNRRLLTPAFHFDILKPYLAVYNKASDIYLGNMTKFAKEKEGFDVFALTTLLTLDILLQCAFSYQSDCQQRGESHPYVKAIAEMTEALVERMLNPLLHPSFIYYLTPTGRKFKNNCDFVHSFSQTVIEKRREVLGNYSETPSSLKDSKYLDFLDILLTARDEEGQGLTDKEIRDEVDTFLFEGHDTTASGISWSLYCLATNQNHQVKCQEEIDEILQGRDSDEITWDDLSKLKYLTMCIKEGMRIQTPVHSILRELTKDTEVDGYIIPAGTMVQLGLYMLHHNPTVWPNSTEFRPDRFSPENLEKMDNFAFVPFSAGPRGCIGQHFAMHEQKLVVARLLHCFSLELEPGHVVRQKISAVTKPETGIRMKAIPRQVNTYTASQD